MSVLSAPWFKDPEAARDHLESIRWPEGPTCPHCGNADGGRIKKVEGKSHRAGLYACRECNGHFTVTVGTLFERSKIPLHKWFLAVHFLCSSKKGMSAHQLHRMLGVTYKTAWFMAHRIREGMRDLSPAPVGSGGKTVEADETFVGGKEKNRHKSKRFKHHAGGNWGKETVFSLVERQGRVQSMHVTSVTAKTLRPILVAQVEKDAFLCTDDAGQYRHMKRDFPKHQVVNHSASEYVRGEAHTNTIENYFSILKRGITGTYHHVSQQHLKRYLAEFDFRYNEREGLGVSDEQRTYKALKGIKGKRLTYGGSRSSEAKAS